MVIGQLNKAAAVCMTLGSAYMLHQEWGPVGGIVGFIGGALAAVITCGKVAYPARYTPVLAGDQREWSTVLI